MKVSCMKVKFTNNIPICPYCKKPTNRTGGTILRTLMYFEPIWDKEGNNINPDRNIETSRWHCLECGKDYQIKGNITGGYVYTLEERTR